MLRWPATANTSKRCPFEKMGGKGSYAKETLLIDCQACLTVTGYYSTVFRVCAFPRIDNRLSLALLNLYYHIGRGYTHHHTDVSGHQTHLGKNWTDW